MVFFYVKYGEDSTKIFNADCPSHVLASHIKKTCGATQYATIDLTDEKGNRRKLDDAKEQPATTLLAERQSYLLVGVSETGEVTKLFTGTLKAPEGKGKKEDPKAAKAGKK
eukprot:tig00000361_g24372.t1